MGVAKHRVPVLCGSYQLAVAVYQELTAMPIPSYWFVERQRSPIYVTLCRSSTHFCLSGNFTSASQYQGVLTRLHHEYSMTRQQQLECEIGCVPLLRKHFEELKIIISQF
jgi:hypothetical protein